MSKMERLYYIKTYVKGELTKEDEIKRTRSNR